MLRPRQEDEVRRVIVEGVTVGVVDDLVRYELRPELQLHDVAVQADLPAVDADELGARWRPQVC